MTMDGDEESRLDTMFDQMLVEMKPHVLRLPHKSERQRCAVWIKKFCEPQTGGLLARKNRNAYARLLAHMLKKGMLEGPFTDRPDPGPLPTLPSYMSIYLDDSRDNFADPNENQMPDWVAGELGSEITGLSSIPTVDLFEDPGSLFPAASQDRHQGACLADDTSDPYFNKKAYYPRERSSSPPRSRSRDRGRHRGPPILHEQVENKGWQNGTGYSTFTTTAGNSLFRDESTTMSRAHSREVEMKTKMMEAKFQEEKLRLQQKHDSNVQKILDRKNTEIDELKRHYRTKQKEHEEVSSKLEKKLGHLQKELFAVKEKRDQEVRDLNKILDENNASKQQDLDRKLSDVQTQFEEEKFSLQKQHTKNIQELLDDTNCRLSKMETEYNQQMEATTAVIRELEGRVQQLGGEAENLGKIRSRLEKDRQELQIRCDHQQTDLSTAQDKCLMLDKELTRQKEDFEGEFRAQKNKYEASIEYLKQEHSLAAVKASDRISDLEQTLSQQKQSIEGVEQHRQNQVRELEQSHQQDKQHLENLNDKKIRHLQQELDQQDQEYQKKLRKLENLLRDKEDEVRHSVENHKHQVVQSEKALEEFKVQVERNSSKMFLDMKEQMGKVEQDLYRSKQLREKQVKEAQKQLEEERAQYHRQVAELRVHKEQDRVGLVRDFHTEKEVWQAEKEQEVEGVREGLRTELVESEARARGKQDTDSQIIMELQTQVDGLKEEVRQANALRKQQLVELGLLREEEKQKLSRQHEHQLAKVQSNLEQQRLEAEKQHNNDTELILEKTNKKVQELDADHTQRAAKANQTILQQQQTIQDLKNSVNRQQEEAEHEITTTSSRLEEEKRKLKQHHATSVMTLQHELETSRGRCRQLDRQLQVLEHDCEERMTHLRGEYDERMRGLTPVTVRQELEDTIASLRQQISFLQQRTALLQDDFDQRSTYTPSGGLLTHLDPHLNASLSTVGSSFKSTGAS